VEETIEITEKKTVEEVNEIEKEDILKIGSISVQLLAVSVSFGGHV
jgi:hypothetical protein